MATKTARPAPEPVSRRTKAEDDGLQRFARQQTMLKTAEERIEDAYRSGFRAGRAVEVKRFNKLVKELTTGENT